MTKRLLLLFIISIETFEAVCFFLKQACIFNVIWFVYLPYCRFLIQQVREYI